MLRRCGAARPNLAASRPPLRCSRALAAHRALRTPTRRAGVQPTRAELQSFGAALRRALASAVMAAAAPRNASAPWRDPAHFTSQRWWNTDTVAVVTGANKGIGKEIVRQLAAQGLTAVLTARNEAAGSAAAKELSADLSLSVPFHQLDTTDSQSVSRFAAWVQATYGGLSILINNAGIAYKGSTFGAEEAKNTIRTNVVGTHAVTQALMPALRARGDARVVNVCSMAGKLRIIRDARLAARFHNATSAEQVLALMDEFVADVAAGRHAERGWPNSMYGVSKLGEATLTRILAAEGAKDGTIWAAAICPGWCATDMSSFSGPKSAAQGADTAVWAALQPRSALPTGRFWTGRQEESF